LDSTDDLTEVKDAINIRYSQVCIEDEAKQTSTTIALVAGTDTYTLASAIDRIETLYVTRTDGTRYGPLEETSIADIRERQSGTTASSAQGNVTHYCLLGIDRLIFWPTPQQADTVNVDYVGQPTALSANADVPILHEPYCSKLLLHGPCADLAEAQRDWEAAKWHAAQFEDWLRRYRTHLNRKKGTTTRQFRVIGTPSFPPHDPSVDVPYRN
jgi:hypothetical protein